MQSLHNPSRAKENKKEETLAYFSVWGRGDLAVTAHASHLYV